MDYFAYGLGQPEEEIYFFCTGCRKLVHECDRSEIFDDLCKECIG